ncbi:MAG: alpha/beta hydrolase [Acidobacteria bacterium]|nr:alpha/beta hydrolase [Acidobacteriota bacterium]
MPSASKIPPKFGEGFWRTGNQPVTPPLPSGFPTWLSRECRIELATAETYYIKEGEGIPVVLVHGLLGYSFCWRKNIPELARHFKVFALDLAGCGQSGEVKTGDCGVSSWSHQLQQFLDAMKLEKVHLVGTSAGGAVAVDFTSQYPERVERMILVAPVNPFSRRVVWLSRIYRWSGPPMPLLRRLVRRMPQLLPWFFRNRYYADPSRITPETIPGYQEGLREEISAQMLRQSIRSWDSSQMESQLARVNLPTLLVWGDQDKLVPPDCLPRLLSALPTAQAFVIPGAGHFCYEELPEVFNQEVIRFLRNEPSDF